jgi:uncharacterized protein with gpF-like domain
MKHQLTEARAKRMMHNIKRVGKVPMWRYPRQYEIAYRALLAAIVDKLRENVLATLQKSSSIILQRDTEAHTDDWSDNLDHLLELLHTQFNETINKEALNAKLLNIGQQTSSWNDKQWQETLMKVLGVDVYRREQFLGSHLKSFVKEGSSLITKLTQDTYYDVATTLTRGIRKGDRVETIKKALLSDTDLQRGVFNKVETRARLIARDQVGKLNGELMKLRQEAIGVEFYRWHTVHDERVRDAHDILDQKICTWNDSTVYADTYEEAKAGNWKQRSDIDAVELHPGEDFQCRCWAEAIFTEEEDLQIGQEDNTEEEE